VLSARVRYAQSEPGLQELPCESILAKLERLYQRDITRLQLYDVERNALLIEQRTRHTAESLSRVFFAAVAKAPERPVDRVV
jgi:hypothetical protein